ncbi:hypothetical protein FS842_004907 [Serendipita sp. 407]|nr:hypothetical protein FS842_004907 [Serendipita sp. 407]
MDQSEKNSTEYQQSSSSETSPMYLTILFSPFTACVVKVPLATSSNLELLLKFQQPVQDPSPHPKKKIRKSHMHRSRCQSFSLFSSSFPFQRLRPAALSRSFTGAKSSLHRPFQTF